jgi:hypothetical protein
MDPLIFANSVAPENRLITGSSPVMPGSSPVMPGSSPAAGSSPLGERLSNPLFLAGLTMLGNLSPSTEPINVMKGVPQAMLAGARLQRELERRQASRQAAFTALRQAGFGAARARQLAESQQGLALGAKIVARQAPSDEEQSIGQPHEPAPRVAPREAGEAPPMDERPREGERDAQIPRQDVPAASRPQPLYRKGQTGIDAYTGETLVFDGEKWVRP